jgi:hypothetical protein
VTTSSTIKHGATLQRGPPAAMFASICLPASAIAPYVVSAFRQTVIPSLRGILEAVTVRLTSRTLRTSRAPLGHVVLGLSQRGLSRPAISHVKKLFIEGACQGFVTERAGRAGGTQQAVETLWIQFE